MWLVLCGLLWCWNRLFGYKKFKKSGDKMIETLNDLVAFWALLVMFFGTILLFISITIARTQKIRKAKIEAAKEHDQDFNDDWI